MNDVAIRVDNLGKVYRLGPRERYRTIRDTLSRLALSPWNKLKARTVEPSKEHKTFWALRDVSFEVARGDVVGIIGRNGAGKSTLLKVLSQITDPTSGSVELTGRVGSLLEVGSGFHPELTGRENIFLNGAILGMKRAEIVRKFDEIVAFAEVEKFIDTPVKHYSSGMYMRLAFAVAAHLEPEILVVDEVLAVGDAEFQKKCLGKMGEVARGGRTVLFVSHNLSAVEQLTCRCVLLHAGRLVFDGLPSEAIGRYVGSFGSAEAEEDVEQISRPRPLMSQQIQFLRARIDHPNAIIGANESIRLRFGLRANAQVAEFRLSATIFRVDGVPVGSWFTDHIIAPSRGEEAEYDVQVMKHSLAPGKYYFGISTGRGNHRTGHVDFDTILNVLHFEVRPPEGDCGTVAIWSSSWGPIVFATPPIKRID
jgi:lipopolysaccharide transport system ATP-binding protein